MSSAMKNPTRSFKPEICVQGERSLNESGRVQRGFGAMEMQGNKTTWSGILLFRDGIGIMTTRSNSHTRTHCAISLAKCLSDRILSQRSIWYSSNFGESIPMVRFNAAHQLQDVTSQIIDFVS
jgi:hypothetical protein